MQIQRIRGEYSVLKYKSAPQNIVGEFLFTAKTDNEFSVVCNKVCAPAGAYAREDGFVGYRVVGQLDFSLLGIIAKIAAVLAAAEISVFVVSTFDTDYFFLRTSKAAAAERSLANNGYDII